MEYVNLGRTGLKVSRICLGMMTYGASKWRAWVHDEPESRPFVKRALELGINYFDTADIYSLGVSEEVLGRAIKEYSRREDVVIATKVCLPMGPGLNQSGLSRVHIFDSIDASLRRLGTDHVDLYQIHRYDPTTPLEETMEALHDVVKAGKARYIGASSMRAYQFVRSQYLADRHGWTRFVTMQNHYNLVYREEEREMVPFCREEGIGLLPWSPLARGFLTGRNVRGSQDETIRGQTDQFAHAMYYQPADYDVVDRVIELANRRGVKPAQVALAWLLHQPAVTAPIIGASKMNHLEEAVAALEIHLSAEEQASLEEPYKPHPVLGMD
ncbi:MAG TPA: aldo/keto reductase [Anaerolineaceae bacterium]|jgi:aryl-alcohol dehydrogenase (NADP+)